MAIGDPNAPEEHERRNFDHPTTKPVRGPRRGRRVEKRLRPSIKLPAEYADFQLDDGRQAIDVLGEAFFETGGGKPLGESTPEQRANGNSAPAAIFEGNPRFSWGPAAPISAVGAMGKPRHAGETLGEAQQLIKQTGKGFRETRGMRDTALELRDAARVARMLYSRFESLQMKAPEEPKTREARDDYFAALEELQEKEKEFNRMLSPEIVGAREMMFRVEGKGPYVTHKIPMTRDGQEELLESLIGLKIE